MILDHELLTAAVDGLKGLAEHSPGIVSSVGGLALYILLRDGIPYYRRKRNGNPGNSNLGERVLGCETAIVVVKESCARTDERWIAQEKFNNRMEKHVENFYKRLEK